MHLQVHCVQPFTFQIIIMIFGLVSQNEVLGNHLPQKMEIIYQLTQGKFSTVSDGMFPAPSKNAL